MPSIKYQGSEKQNLRTFKQQNVRNVQLIFGQKFQKCVNSEFSKLSHSISLRLECIVSANLLLVCSLGKLFKDISIDKVEVLDMLSLTCVRSLLIC